MGFFDIFTTSKPLNDPYQHALLVLNHLKENLNFTPEELYQLFSEQGRIGRTLTPDIRVKVLGQIPINTGYLNGT